MENNESQDGNAVVRIAVISKGVRARAGIVRAVTSQAGMQVAGQYDSCRAALTHILETPPDVVVVDMRPCGNEVLDTISRCRTTVPQIAPVVMVERGDLDLAERAFKAGARAILRRGDEPVSLVSAIRAVVAGEVYVCRSFYRIGPGPSPARGKESSELRMLSRREFQVFTLMASGWDDQSIVNALGISSTTLNVHLERMKKKLNQPTTQSLRARAVSWLSQ
jgi:DNA-binding NarL/FixJ family response regulator